MKNSSASRIIWLVAASFFSAACEKEEPVRTRDDIAADSALAADLALANRDTLLIDSIGQYNPPGGMGSDTSLSAIDTVVPPGALPREIAGEATTVRPAPVPAPAPAASRPAPPAARPDAPAARPSPPRPVAKSSPARRTTGDPCSSPGVANQQRCVRSRLAEADRRLNGVYRALITEMRRQEGARPGQKDPASVERLRAAQRSWLVHRDTECR
ncbi:MAG: DUF1311 domain-containing protein, partial [Gemmatimonadota bacterium]|nr:DUF1311 domain-containing protein [Gemmatimonadota bacterium]